MKKRTKWIQTKNLTLKFVPRYLGEFSAVLKSVRERKKRGFDLPFPIAKQNGHWLVLGNEAQFMAAKRLRIKRLPCIVVEDERLHARQTISSLLGPMENPLDVAYRIRQHQKEYSLTQQELGQEFGTTQANISFYLQLTRKLYPETERLYRESLKICDESRNVKNFPTRRLGAGDIGFRHLLELTYLHHSSSGFPEKRAKQLQLNLMDKMTTKCVSTRQLNIERKAILKRPAAKPSKVLNIPRVEVYHADCLHAANVLVEETVDMVITSPPYNIGRDYEKKRLTLLEHLDNVIPGLQVSAKLLKPGCWMFVNFMDHCWGLGDYYPYRDDVIRGILECDMVLHSPSIWIKPWSSRLNMVNERRLHTEYNLMQNLEYFLAFKKKGEREIDPELSDLAKREIQNDAKKNEWTMLRSDLPYISTKRGHSENGDVGNAAFCRPLVSFLIRLFSFPNDRVLDPFCGTASALTIAEEHGRYGIGFERSAAQCKHLGSLVSKKRVPKVEPDLPLGWRRVVETALNELAVAGLKDKAAMHKSRMAV